MKALILDSGIGIRIGDLTKNKPKCLIDISKQTILGLQLQYLSEYGIKDVIITTGPFKEQIKDFVTDNFPDMNVRFVYNPKYSSTNYIYTMWLTKDLIDDDIILMHGDMVFDKVVLNKLLNSDNKNCVLVNNSIPPPEKDFKARIEGGKIKEIGVDVFGPNWFFLAPVYKFSKESFLDWINEIEKFVKKGNIKVYAENALNRLLNDLGLFPIYLKEELCMEVDDEKDLVIAKEKLKEIEAMKRKLKKIMLISPKYTLYKYDVRRCVTPLGLAYLAAFLEKQSYKVKILDVSAEGYFNVKKHGDFVTYGLDDEEIKKRIMEFKPNIVGVSCIFSTQSKNVKELLKLVKDIDKNIITFTGGSHPTYSIENMLGYVNYIIMGEGELSTLQLLDTLNNGKDISKIGGIAYRKEGKTFINNNLQYIENIDDLPFPARYLLNMELYFKINMPQNPYPQGKRVAQVITSRGCPARCVFCTTTNFWGNRYRGRSPESVVAEIRELKEKYNVDEIQFTDDNLTFDKERVIKILDGIKDLGLMWCVPQGIAIWALDEELLERMKESGCYQLTFAVESGNQEVLNKIIKKPLNLKKVKPLVKKAHEIGIQIHAFCICGLPGETIKQMHETYNFVKDCKFDSASFFLATPLVGSELLKICKKEGYLRQDIKGNEMLYKIGNISTPEFKAEEVQKLVEHFNKTYNRDDTREKRFKKEKY